MIQVPGLVLFTWFMSAAAGRSIRLTDALHNLRQQTDGRTRGLEVSTEARDAFLPQGAWRAPLRRWGLRAGSLWAADGRTPQSQAPRSQRPSTIPLPAELREMGCDEDLWSNIRAKAAFVRLLEAGDKAGAKERLDMLRNAPSITGERIEMPAVLADWGCDQQLWDSLRSKKQLYDAASKADKIEGKRLIEKFKAAVAKGKARPPKPPKAPAAPKAPKKVASGGGLARPLKAGYTLDGEPPAGADLPTVEKLLADRVAAKLAKDYETADRLQAELLAMGISTNDRLRTWSGTPSAKQVDREVEEKEDDKGGLARPVMARYTLDGEPPAGADLPTVETLLADRLAAKLAKDYETADRLQAELRAMGISTNDWLRTWSGTPLAKHVDREVEEEEDDEEEMQEDREDEEEGEEEEDEEQGDEELDSEDEAEEEEEEQEASKLRESDYEEDEQEDKEKAEAVASKDEANSGPTGDADNAWEKPPDGYDWGGTF